MRIVKNKITLTELKEMARAMFGDLVKAVVDVKREIMAIGGELHSDEEAALLADGSKQENLWGINIYPDVPGTDWIEIDSVINIRPSQGNRSRGIDNPEIRKKVIEIVCNLVER
jgi:hypothetical protein